MLDAENPDNTSAGSPPADAPGAVGVGAVPTGSPTDELTGDPTGDPTGTPAKKTATKRTATKKTAKKSTAKKATDESAATADPDPFAASAVAADPGEPAAPTRKAVAKKATAKKTTAKKTTAQKTTAQKTTAQKTTAQKTTAQKTTAAKKTAKKTTAKQAAGTTDADVSAEPAGETAPAASASVEPPPGAASAIMPTFQAPDPARAAQPAKKAASAKRAASAKKAQAEPSADEQRQESAPDRTPKKQAKRNRKPADDADVAQVTEVPEAPEVARVSEEQQGEAPEEQGDFDDDQGGSRRRRRRGGRRRRKGGGSEDGNDSAAGGDDSSQAADEDEAENGEGTAGGRRRRRRRRAGDEGDAGPDDPNNTVTKVRKVRSAEDEITSLHGSTRLEAKKQRRREGREAGRRRAPIVSEAEFLARREAVDRVMVIRQKKDLTQIAVLEDKVLVEHYVARESQTSLIGNVYLGRVQNVLPSMEAAFIDIGKGRNAVLYAGEVNWDARGAKNGGQRKVEQVLKSGQPILVQVSKDPIGHKGARLTSQISLPGRFLVYVPDGTTSGISRKLPDTERSRLKTLLKEIVPAAAGVIVRTAAEGASEEELTRDVERLTARWDDIESKVNNGNAPQLLYGEPDLTLKVVRDLFTEDFAKLVVSGDDAWDMVDGYVEHVAPDLAERLERYDRSGDVFAAYRIDEQIAKGLDRKVWLPSGGSLVIDRTEAMTVVDVNTGKFTGSGGNLEETVTKNNLEAAEEIVRQLRLRDIGGIIVVDFIDMVLESNRDLVLRRMVECLGRDRTRHQVAEVTSLGLVQMTRKRIGTGLLEAFSESCEHCQGRGLIVHHEPVESKKLHDDEPRRNRRGGRDRGRGGESGLSAVPSPKDVAAMAAKPDASVVGSEQTAEKPAPEVAERQSTPVQPQMPAPAGEPRAAAGQEEQPAAEENQPRTSSVTRRRSARRPAGPPAGLEAVVEEETATDVAAGEPAVADQPVADEVEVDTATSAVDVADPEPVAPTIVTSVRRRGARRAAGPPSDPIGSPAAGSDGSGGSSDGSDASGGSSDGASGEVPVAADSAGSDPDRRTSFDGVDGDEDQTAAVHVPVKKKGSRKR